MCGNDYQYVSWEGGIPQRGALEATLLGTQRCLVLEIRLGFDYTYMMSMMSDRLQKRK